MKRTRQTIPITISCETGVNPPTEATEGSAGYDVKANLKEPLTLESGKTTLIPTGFRLHLENPGYTALLFPRSGLASKYGVTLANNVAVIDSDFVGEVFVALRNTSDTPYTIEPKERIAQMVIVPCMGAMWRLVPRIDPSISDRGVGGFGSTGRA